MNHLTDEQVEIITNRISQNSILSAELKDDLIDHFCCIIEEELKNGVDFSEAYDKAYNEICPNGFEDIQRETIFLINEKKLKIMKKTMYLFGLISSVGITVGALFKLQHWAY